MSDTRTFVLTIVGTGVGLAVLLTSLMYALISGVNPRIDDVRGGLSTRMHRIEARLDGTSRADGSRPGRRAVIG